MPASSNTSSSAPVSAKTHLRRWGPIVGLLLIGSTAALYIMSAKSNEPEKIRENFSGFTSGERGEFGSGSNQTAWAVRDGQIFQIYYQESEITIKAQPLQGGTIRTIYTGKLRPDERLRLDSTFVTNEGLWLYKDVIIPPKKNQTVGSFVGGGGGTGTGVSGKSATQVPRLRYQRFVYRQPETSIPPQLSAAQRTQTGPLSYPSSTSFWNAQHIASDGTSRVIDICDKSLMGSEYNRVIVDDTVFWHQTPAIPRAQYITVEPGKPPTQTTTILDPAKTTLFMRRLSDNSPKRLAEGLTDPTLFLPLQDGVALMQYRDYPDKRTDLLIFRAPDYHPVRLSDYSMTGALKIPCFANDRFWWLEDGKQDLETGTTHLYLVSAAADGTDVRRTPIDSDAKKRPIYQPTLSACRNRLYLSYITDSTAPGARWDTGQGIHCLALISLDSESRVQPFLQASSPVPQKVTEKCVDGDYLYFVKNEEQKSFLDVFSANNTAHAVANLYRVAIPH